MTYSRRRFALLLIFCAVVACPAAAQTRDVTPTGVNAAPAPFDVSAVKLPPEYDGTNLGGLLDALKARTTRLVKDEFETTAQFKERVRAEEAKPLYGSITAEGPLTVAAEPSAVYNADEETMVVQFEVPARLGEVSFTEGVGVTYRAKIKMDIPKARRSKPALRALVVFTLVRPYLEDGRLTAAAREVWFYDRSTGEVFDRRRDGAIKQSLAAESLIKARELYAAGRDDEALTELRNVVRLEPMKAEAYLITGRIYLRRGEIAPGISQLKASIFWDTEHKLIDAHILLGRIYLERGDRPQAQQYARSALEIDPTNAEARALQADTLR